jgi:hypothetical protein
VKAQVQTTSSTIVEKKQKVRLDTRSDCKLAVAFWPMFSYDASAGSSLGVAESATRNGRNVRIVKFDPPHCSTPPLNWKTTKILGLVPIPPPIQICIETKELSVCCFLASHALSKNCNLHGTRHVSNRPNLRPVRVAQGSTTAGNSVNPPCQHATRIGRDLQGCTCPEPRSTLRTVSIVCRDRVL